MHTAKKVKLLETQVAAANRAKLGDTWAWCSRTEQAMQAAMGEDSELTYRLRLALHAGRSAVETSRIRGGLPERDVMVSRAVSILEEAIFALELDEAEAEAEAEATTPSFPLGSGETVFVVHGHDRLHLAETENVITRLTGTSPVILHQHPNGGRTVIEKFEMHAETASFAVALLTADDVGRAKASDDDRTRARQNVVLEAGYFMGRLGRSHVVLLYESGVELPSDLNGILYVELDPDGRWKSELSREMRSAGLPADANNL